MDNFFGFPRNSFYSYIRVSSPNGYGSTATKIRVYDTLYFEGTGMSRFSSAAMGDWIVINRGGLLIVTINDYRSAGNCAVGISLNSNSLTTDVTSLSITERIGVGIIPVGLRVSVTGSVIVKAGDIIRHHGGLADASGDSSTMMQLTLHENP